MSLPILLMSAQKAAKTLLYILALSPILFILLGVTFFLYFGEGGF